MPPRRRRSGKNASAKKRGGRREDSPNPTGVGPEIPKQSFLESIGLGTTPAVDETVLPPPVDDNTIPPPPVDEGSEEVGREPENEEIVAPVEEVKTKKKRNAAKKGPKKGTKKNKPKSRCAAYCRMQKKRFCPPTV